MFNNDHLVQLHARAYNTLMEMAWTFNNEELPKEIVERMTELAGKINNNIIYNEYFGQADKNQFLLLTDMIQNRIYFRL